MLLVLDDVSFSYDASPVDALQPVTASLPRGWTGVVGANGIGKTTLLRLVAAELTPLTGTITRPGDAVYCAQPTDVPPALLDEFALDWGAGAGRLRSVLRIGGDWPYRFGTLSHGERKRLQLAVALWRRPHVLAVDEPTNHLDEQARALIRDAFGAFDGIGLLVSHDRELLDTLTERCLFLERSGVTVRPGNYSAGRAQAQLEAESAAHERENAKRELVRLREVASRRRIEADRSPAMRSKARIDPRNRDAKGRIDLAVFTGKDGQAGRLSSQLDSRLKRAEERLDAARVEKTLGGGGIWLPQGRSRRAVVAELPASVLPLGPQRTLRIPGLRVGPTARVAIIGPNGAGKSTLTRALLAGTRLDADRMLVIPQEVTRAEAEALMGELHDMTESERGAALAIVARLGSAPARLLSAAIPSPGETRKLMLALGVLRGPHLVVLDEPTNHLDLPAIEALESALAECPCTLVLVSHDRRFVERLAEERWRIDIEDSGDSLLRTELV